MVLGTLVSHSERTKLDSYLILYSKWASRWMKELNVKTETTREPEENKHNTKVWNHSKKIDWITKHKTVGKIQHANLKGKLQTWKLVVICKGSRAQEILGSVSLNEAQRRQSANKHKPWMQLTTSKVQMKTPRPCFCLPFSKDENKQRELSCATWASSVTAKEFS